MRGCALHPPSSTEHHRSSITDSVTQKQWMTNTIQMYSHAEVLLHYWRASWWSVMVVPCRFRQNTNGADPSPAPVSRTSPAQHFSSPLNIRRMRVHDGGNGGAFLKRNPLSTHVARTAERPLAILGLRSSRALHRNVNDSIASGPA
jgi:hypothetical protein